MTKQILGNHLKIFCKCQIKRPARDACLYMGESRASLAPPARFVFLITDRWADSLQIWQVCAVALGNFYVITLRHWLAREQLQNYNS